MKKFFVYTVAIATIVWSAGILGVVPLATASYSPSAGDLIKTADDPAVYYVDSEHKRHLFVNEVTFWTWYSGDWSNIGYGSDSKTVEVVSQSDFGDLEAGDNVTVRPGSKLIKFKNSPRVYAVTPGGDLREVVDSDSDDSVAVALYGEDYEDRLITIQNGFEANYSKGDALTADSNLPDGSLVQYEGSDDIYYIEDDQKRPIEDSAFIANGFKDSSVVTVPSSMTYSEGESITGEEADLTTVAGSESSSSAAAGSSLTVALASDTPAAGLAVSNANRVPFTKIALTASADGDITVDSVTIERTGASADSNFSSVALIDGDTNVQIGLNQNLNANHQANVNNDFTVPAGTTKNIILAGNMASGTAGQTPSLTLANIILDDDSTVVGSLPIVGNIQTMTSLTIGQVTVERGGYENATSSTLKVGTTGYILSSYKFSADSTEGQEVEQIKYYQSGTASLSTDIGNYQLLINGTTEIDAEFTIDGKYLTAEFSDNPVEIEKGRNEEITLKADVLGGSTRTIKMGIYRTTDVVSRGSLYGYTRTPTYSGTGVGDLPELTSNQFTISSGTLRVESSSTIGAQDVSYGDTQTLGAFDFVVAGESVSITQLVLTNSSTTADSTKFNNVKLVDADSGEIYWGPSSADSTAADDITYTSTVELPTGTTVINVVADIESTGGFAGNDTFYYKINPSNMTVTGVKTDESITATPSAAVSASTMTFKAAKLTITRESSPTDSSVVVGTDNFLYGSWVFDTTGSGEDVRVTAIVIGNQKTKAGSSATSINVDNLTLYDTSLSGESECLDEYPNATYSDSYGCKLDPIKAQDSSGTTTFNLTDPMVLSKSTQRQIQLRADVRDTEATYSGQTDEFVINHDGSTKPVTAKGVLTNSTITPTGSGYEASDGADITITGKGTLTINTAAARPAARILGENQTYEVNRVKLTATKEAIDLTDLAICIDDGGETGTAAGNQDDVTTVQVFKSDDLSNPIIDSPLSSVCQAFVLDQGDLQIPVGSSGVDLVIKATTAKVDNSSIYEAGTANADFKLGFGGTNMFRGTGVDSGSAVSETHTASTGSAMILHRSYPSVTINDLPSGNYLISGEPVLYDFTISNPSAETIAIYRLSFAVSTSGSSGSDIGVSKANIWAKRSGWNSWKRVAADTKLAFDAGTDGAEGEKDAYFSAALQDPDSEAICTEMRISSGESVQFQFRAVTVQGTDGTAGEMVNVTLLGDVASSTGVDISGHQAEGHQNVPNGFSSVQGFSNQQVGTTLDGHGNFVWSDLYENSGSSHSATTAKQWYNGYLVDGLSTTNTWKSIQEQSS